MNLDYQQMRQLEDMKKQLMGKILTKEAVERLARVRVAKPQLAEQVELYLMQLFQAGKIPEPLPDDKLRDVLATLSEKREITIRRK